MLAPGNFIHVEVPADDDMVVEGFRQGLCPFSQSAIVNQLLYKEARARPVLQVLREGLVPPDLVLAENVNQAMIHGAAGCSVELVRALVLEYGVDPTARDTYGATPLHLAIYGKNDEAAFFLARDAPRVDLQAVVRPAHTTVLVAAACHGMRDVVAALVARGADVDERDARGMSVTLCAMEEGHEDTAVYLLEQGADWSVPCGCSNLPSIAAAEGLFRVLRGLVRRIRADAAGDARMVETWLTKAAEGAIAYDQMAALRLLVEEEGLDARRARCAVHVPHDDDSPVRHSLLHHAALFGNVEAAAYLVGRGCDPLAVDSGDLMPHMVAAKAGHLPVLQWLLAHAPGLDVNVQMTGRAYKTTALDFAAIAGQFHVVRWLIEQGGADPWPALRLPEFLPSKFAEEAGHLEIVRYLHPRELATAARRLAEAGPRVVREAEAAARAEAARAEQGAAAAKAEEEAVARRARNEKRRQKMKKAKARLRAAEAAAALAGAAEQEEQEGDEDAGATGADLEPLAAAVEGVSLVDGAAASGGDGGGGGGSAGTDAAAEPEQEPQQQEEPPATPASAAPTAPAIARPPPLHEFLERDAPEGLLCPITLALFDDPVLLFADGCTYSRAAIEEHLDLCRQQGKPLTSPKTNLEIDPAQALLASVVLIRSQVLEYKEAKTREWEAAERAWRDSVEGQGKEQA